MENNNSIFRFFVNVFLKIFSIFVKLCILPQIKIKARYAIYNAQISDMIKTMSIENISDKEQINYLHIIRKQNVALVNFFLLFPRVIGIISLILYVVFKKDPVYTEYNAYYIYFLKVFRGIEYTSFINFLQKIFERIYSSIIHQPIGLNEIYIIVGTFVITGIGTYILGKHPAFEHQKNIEHVLTQMKKFDGSDEKRPWKVTWTPNALMFEIFGEDPEKFLLNTAFWKTISFSPSGQIIEFEDNHRKFIVEKKYRLPVTMPIKYKELEKENE